MSCGPLHLHNQVKHFLSAVISDRPRNRKRMFLLLLLPLLPLLFPLFTCHQVSLTPSKRLIGHKFNPTPQESAKNPLRIRLESAWNPPWLTAFSSSDRSQRHLRTIGAIFSECPSPLLGPSLPRNDRKWRPIDGCHFRPKPANNAPLLPSRFQCINNRPIPFITWIQFNAAYENVIPLLATISAVWQCRSVVIKSGIFPREFTGVGLDDRPRTQPRP